MSNLKRRDLLKSSLAMAGVSCIPAFLSNQAAAQVATTGRLVFVFLRGGADPLSMVVPSSGSVLTALQAARPNLLPSAANQVSLMSGLNLHRFMNPLLTDAQLRGTLNFVLHSGSPYDTRSHFEQMARIESGDFSALRPDGFMGRACQALNRASFGIGPVMPDSLRGTNPVVLQDPAKLQPAYIDSSAGKDWRFGSGFTRADRLGMYKIGTGETGDTTVHSMAVTAQTQYDLIDDTPTTLAQLIAQPHGYMNTPFGQRLATTALMLASKANPAMVAVEAERVWDTHAQQLTNDPSKYNSFGLKISDFAQNMLAFKRDLVARGLWATTSVVVVTEFGRTIKENANQGSDHGRGGLMMLMGGKIRPITHASYLGPRAWTLPAGTLNSSSALDVQIDMRIILHEVMQKACGIPAATVNAALPGITSSQWKGVVV